MDDKGFNFALSLMALIIVIVWIAAIYVAVHFLAKVW